MLIELDLVDLAFALAMITLAIGLSRWQTLALEGQLFMAAVRSLLQLTVVGYVLAFIFALDNPWAVIAILAVMLTIAAIVTRNRIGKKIPRLLWVVWASLLTSTTLVMGYTIILIVEPPRWYEPQYLIPLAGMVLGSTINSASLAGERLVSAINSNRLEIETHLCLGATPQQAIVKYRQEAIRTGLIPLLNQMMVVGLVSLPGMFTGQVLAGADPLNAVSYQLLILFMLALANTLTTSLITRGIYQRFFNQHSQLLGI